jgi:hypothetical protein
MPLTPKYTWEQDEGSVSLTIALSSAAATRNARVECTDAMIKVTCPPYFLQVSFNRTCANSTAAATQAHDRPCRPIYMYACAAGEATDC